MLSDPHEPSTRRDRDAPVARSIAGAGTSLPRLGRSALATGLLPVDEQEATRGVERGGVGPRGDLELELFDRPVGAVPAVQRPVTRSASTREQHDVNHGIVRNELVVLV